MAARTSHHVWTLREFAELVDLQGTGCLLSAEAATSFRVESEQPAAPANLPDTRLEPLGRYSPPRKRLIFGNVQSRSELRESLHARVTLPRLHASDVFPVEGGWLARCSCVS